MSSIQESTELSLVFNSLRQRLARYLPESSERAQVIAQSTAFGQVSYATIKNIPYAFLSKELGTYDLAHMLSSRITYLEATMLAMMSTACNVVFALFYTALSIATLGLSDSINFGMRKHSYHVIYGLGSSVVGFVGVITPYYGGALNVYLLYAIFNLMRNCYDRDLYLFERPLLKEIQDITRNYSPIVYNYTREKIQNDIRYQRVFKPFLERIEREVHGAKKMDDLIALILDVRDQWPRAGSDDYKPTSSETKPIGTKAIHKHYE